MMSVPPSSVSALLPSRFPLHAGLSWHASFSDSGKQSRVVAFGLVGIHLGKVGNGLVEDISGAQIAADLCWVTRARVRPRQGRPAELDVGRKPHQVHLLDLDRELHVSQLSPIVMPATEGRPPQEDITVGLHHMLSYHHPL